MGFGRREVAAVATLAAWTSTFLLIPALHALDHDDDDHIHLGSGAIVHLGGHHHHHDAIDEFIPAVKHAHAPAQDQPRGPAFELARSQSVEPPEALPFFIAHGSGSAAHFGAALLAVGGELELAEQPLTAAASSLRARSQRPPAPATRSVSARGPPALLA